MLSSYIESSRQCETSGMGAKIYNLCSYFIMKRSLQWEISISGVVEEEGIQGLIQKGILALLGHNCNGLGWPAFPWASCRHFIICFSLPSSPTMEDVSVPWLTSLYMLLCDFTLFCCFKYNLNGLGILLSFRLNFPPWLCSLFPSGLFWKNWSTPLRYEFL